ncbi:Kelch-like protein 40a [Apiospora kogelbergensis]|uniref:Kelch-like protein 40a n=1 Tax=Apiospora kogelbergensis TaxID=1337665 RepID=UPI003130C48C
MASKTDIKTVGDSRLFETGMMFDTVIICKDRRWGLHRSILASRCQWFMENLVPEENQEEDKMLIRLHELSGDLLHTLLKFIYTSEIEHAQISDNRVLATLFNMSVTFKLPTLRDAVLDEATRLAGVIASGRRSSGYRPFTIQQLDELFGAVRIAYSGEYAQQKSLRKFYQKLFIDCNASVRKSRYFYDCMRTIPVFMVDITENTNFSVRFAEQDSYIDGGYTGPCGL